MKKTILGSLFLAILLAGGISLVQASGCGSGMEETPSGECVMKEFECQCECGYSHAIGFEDCSAVCAYKGDGQPKCGESYMD